jgi:hypothetical protein
MPWQLTHWNIVWRFLQFEDLLIDELRLLVHHEERVERTFVTTIGRCVGSPGTCSRKCDSSEAGSDWQSFCMLAISALDVESGGF